MVNGLETTINNMQLLEQQVTRLVEKVSKLELENQSLHNRQENLVSERASLLVKNEQARTRIEAMINRLRALDQAP